MSSSAVLWHCIGRVLAWAYERALEPKKLVLLKGGHFDAYVKSFDEASSAARDWFVEHLVSA